MYNVGDLVLVITERKDEATPIIGKIKEVASETFVNNGTVSKNTIYKIDGKIYGSGDVLGVGDKIEDDLEIFSITNDSVFAEDEEGKYCIKVDDFYYCTTCGRLHVNWGTIRYLDDDEPICECADNDEDDEIDEYTSGYADAIRDCIEYLKNSDGSMVRNTLRKMNISYMSDLDTDAKIAEFVEKRFEKKPQLTLDELKKIVGYDFDLV